MFTTIIIFIAVLSLLVFVHEWGHYYAAKKNGVAVEEFSIGFPPRIFSWKKDGTLYSINIIPLGGYVKLKGEGGEHADDEDSFAHKKIWQRATILFAGVAMNFLTAVVMLSFGLMVGFPMPVEDKAALGKFAQIRNEHVQIIQVLPDSPAEEAGIRMGDVITSINGVSFSEINEVQNAIDTSNTDVISVVLERGEESITQEITPYALPDVERKGIGVALAKTGIVSYPIWYAPIKGLERSITMSGQILDAFGMIIGNLVSREKVDMQLSGPVGIAVLTGQIAELGFVYLMQFTALLSINLAILNLVPFPALDGSHLLLLGLEKLRGRRLSEKIEQWVHLSGFALLMLLMIIVTYQDIIRFFK